jgi:hypothetical protein
MEIENLFNDLPKENIENSMELLKQCKLACNELKAIYDTDTPSTFIKKVNGLHEVQTMLSLIDNPLPDYMMFMISDDNIDQY